MSFPVAADANWLNLSILVLGGKLKVFLLRLRDKESCLSMQGKLSDLPGVVGYYRINAV